MSRDPAGYVNGLSLYLYALAAPIDWIDALGLDVMLVESPWWVRWTDWMFPEGAQNEAEFGEKWEKWGHS